MRRPLRYAAIVSTSAAMLLGIAGIQTASASEARPVSMSVAHAASATPLLADGGKCNKKNRDDSTTQPDTTQPDTTQPDTTQPDTTQPTNLDDPNNQTDTTQTDTNSQDHQGDKKCKKHKKCKHKEGKKCEKQVEGEGNDKSQNMEP